MSKKIAITTESASDLSSQLQKEYNIKVIPMGVIVGDEQFKDCIDLNAKELFEKAELYGTAPKTASVSTHEYKLVFETLTEKGYDIVHIAVSSKLSSCYQNAQFAANGFENVFVIDSLTLSSGLALLCIEAAEIRSQGKDTQEIVQGVERLKALLHTSILSQDAKYLFSDGKVTQLEKIGSDLLGLHPSAEVNGGTLVAGKKYMGKPQQSRKKFIDDCFAESQPNSEGRCFLSYSLPDSEEATELAAYIKETTPAQQVITSEAGCCVCAHCGDGLISAAFIGS